MKTKLIELIDFEKVDTLLEGFNKTTGFVTAILDLEGNVLSKSGWRQMCNDFHRINPETSKYCTISDTELAGKLAEGKKYHFYKCLNGLVDVAVPIVIHGEHIANLFSGQFFFEKADRVFFKKQARKYGFNEKKYLEALEKVPVVSKEKVHVTMEFLLNMTQLISETIVQKHQQIELNKALKESEENLSITLRSIGDGVISTDKNGKVVHMNPVAEKLCGWQLAEAAGKPLSEVFDIVNGETREVVADPMKKVLENGEVAGLAKHTVLISKNGTEYQIADSAAPIKNKEGEITGVVLVFSDVTEKYAAEVALRKNESTHRNLIERMPDGVYKSTHDGKFVEVNPAMVKILGYESKEELMAIDIKSQLYFDPGDRESLVLEEKLEEMGIYRLKKKDGSAVWVEDHGWYSTGENGEILFHEGILRDITDRRQAEVDLRNERLLLRTVIDNIPDSIYCKDTAGRKTLANHTELQYSGVTSETEIMGKTDFDLYPKELAEAFFADDQVVLQTGQPVLNREEFVFDNNGLKKWLLTSKLPMKDEVGNITGIIGIGRDITIRRQALEEIKLKNEELSSINAEKDKFFSIIAHDLKGPFTGFLGLTRIMAEELPSLTAVEVQIMAESMRNSANSLYHLLENLLEWSQIQQGAIPFHPVAIQLGEVVGSNIDMIYESAKRKEIEITTDIADGLLAYADMNMFQTIIRNLVLNAIKFTHKRGKVSISAKATTDNYIEISIQDTGIGMSQNMIDNLFRIDVQTNRTGTEAEPSTGLGLLLCKEFSEKNGGKIRVESQEANLPAGKAGGSTFYFTLPIYASPESESNNRIEILNPEKEVQIKPEVSGLRILIAEDDETSGKLISIHVLKFGNEIINVQNGREAVEACRNNPGIDLILMDIQMPEMNGYEATRHIRQLNTEVIIIALTAFAMTGDREKAIEAGCNDYISKPIRKEELFALIQKYFK